MLECSKHDSNVQVFKWKKSLLRNILSVCIFWQSLLVPASFPQGLALSYGMRNDGAVHF